MVFLKVLLIEDNIPDQLLFKMALDESQRGTWIDMVSDGEAAVEYLFQRGNYKDSPRPDLIILDINIPKKSGREVLREVKDDDRLREIPIIAMSGSRSSADINAMNHSGAVCYVTKPLTLDGFLSVIRTIEDFGIKSIESPRRKKQYAAELSKVFALPNPSLPNCPAPGTKSGVARKRVS